MDARLVASRLPGIAMYGQPFNAPPFPGYLPYGPTDASAFYSPLQAGENADAWRAGLTQAAAAYYDPAITAHYGYGYGPMGLSDGARRKNATRETTSTLKAWLNEHRKNPYPTKGEKIMLAIITKMTLTQVSTWFANARRRLKKENKMTWSPRNRCGEDDDDDIMDGDDDNNLNNNSNNRDSFTSSANHLAAGESNNSRCSSPSSSTLGNGPVAEGPNRVSGFDLPQQGVHHPFVPRPDITGSFSIRGPTNSQVIAHDKESESKNQRRSSNADGEEEIDLESVDDLNKDTAFVKRSSMSNDSHSKDVATSYSAHFNRPVVSSPLGNQTASPNTGLFPNVPTPSAFHPSMGNSSHAAAASLLAATRGHSLPPHVLAGMKADQRHSSQGILNIPNPPLSQHLSSFGPAPSKLSPQSSRRNSTSPSAHPYSRNAASSPASSLASSSSTNCSPLKPKIWSLADVATSHDGSKNTSHEDTKSISSISFPNSSLLSSSPTLVHDRGLHMSHSGPIPSHQTVEGFSQATLRNWMDGMMQHKMAAAAAAAAAMSGGQPHPPFFPGAMLPQHLAAALNPAALAVAASMPRGGDGGRFPHPFSGFAELAAAQQRAHMAAHIAGVHHMQSSPVSAPQHAHTTGISKMTTPIPSRHRINSVTNTKSHSHVSSSPPHSVSQHLEISGFTPLNTRPDSSDSGIVSAETSKDSLTQGNESTNSK